MTTTRISLQGAFVDLEAEVYRTFFERIGTAQFVADVKTGCIRDANSAFCSMAGYAHSELLSTGAKSIHELFYVPEGEEPLLTSTEPRKVDLLCSDGTQLPVEVTVATLSEGKDSFAMGTITDLTRVTRLEESVRREKQSVRNYLQTNVRIMQLTHRMMRLPSFLEFLESHDEEKFLYSGVCDFMTEAQHMEFAAAAIFRRDPNSPENLLLRHAVGFDYPDVLPQDEDNPICLVARGELSVYEDNEGNICLPVPVGGEVDGVLVVQYHEVTHQFVEEDKILKETLLDLLLTLAKVFGTRLQNIQLMQTVQEQTVTDALTKVNNRRFFDQKLAEEFERARRYGHPLSLVMIDLDKFKPVNDTLGHQQGDALLIDFAELMRNSTRKSDFICRMGGDEFALILPETPHWAAAVKAEKLRKMIESYEFPNVVDENGPPISISLSIGVAGIFDDMENVDAFYQEADDVLYVSKNNGRNRVTVARPDIAKREAREALKKRREAGSAGRSEDTGFPEQNSAAFGV